MNTNVRHRLDAIATLATGLRSGSDPFTLLADLRTLQGSTQQAIAALEAELIERGKESGLEVSRGFLAPLVPFDNDRHSRAVG
jgi:hypothetical protein